MPKKNFGIFSPKITDPEETYIIGVDPGVTTGLSVIGFSGEPPMPEDITAWGSDQISYGGSGNSEDLLVLDEEFIEQIISHRIANIADYISRKAPEADIHVVIEDFIIRRMDSSRDFLSPVRITAGLKQELYYRLINEKKRVKIWTQSVSNVKGTCTDQRMDKWGYKIATQKDRHSRDADRHAVFFLRKLIEKPELKDVFHEV